MTNPMDEAVKAIILPKTIDETGKEVARTDVLEMITQLAQLGQLVKIRKSLEREEFEGVLDPRNRLPATDELQWIHLVLDHPYRPWITGYAFNWGPNPVFISVNDSFDFRRLVARADMELNFAKADRRIEIIYYRCDPGETAVFDLLGKY